MKTIGYISTFLVLSVYGAILNGWALSKLWLWFIVKTFGLPALTIPAAIGVALVVGYLTKQIDENKKNDDQNDALIKMASLTTFKPLFALGLGWIVKLWL